MSKRTSRRGQGLLSLPEKIQVPDPRLKLNVIREGGKAGSSGGRERRRKRVSVREGEMEGGEGEREPEFQGCP